MRARSRNKQIAGWVAERDDLIAAMKLTMVDFQKEAARYHNVVSCLRDAIRKKQIEIDFIREKGRPPA